MAEASAVRINERDGARAAVQKLQSSIYAERVATSAAASTVSSPSDPSLTFVSLSFLLRFAACCCPPYATTFDLVQNIIKPATKDRQCRLTDLIAEGWTGDASENSSVSSSELPFLGTKADLRAKGHFFVSHSWSGSFHFLVQQLLAFADGLTPRRRPEDLFIWLDVFAVVQHQGNNSQKQDLERLPQRVRDAEFGVVASMDCEGSLLTRAWCLFELHTTLSVWGSGTVNNFSLGRQRALSSKAAGLAICFPDDFVSTEFKQIYSTLDVQRARATVESDRVKIMGEWSKSSVPQKELNWGLKQALIMSYEAHVARKKAIMENYSIKHSTTSKQASRLATQDYFRSLSILTQMLSFEGHSNALKLQTEVTDYCLSAECTWHPSAVSTELSNHATMLQARRPPGSGLRIVELLKKSLQICQDNDDEEGTAVVLHNLGLEMKDGQHDLRAAEIYLRQCMALENRLDPSNPSIGITMSNLADVLGQLDPTSEDVNPLYHVALQKCQRGYGAESEEVADVEYGYAQYLMTRSEEQALQVAYRRAKNALATRLTIFGQNHSKFVLSAQQVAQVEIQKGDLQSAEKSIRMADQGCSLGPDRSSPLLAQQLNLESNLALAQGRFQEAEKLAQQFLDAQVQLFGADHPILATARKALQMCRDKKSGAVTQR